MNKLLAVFFIIFSLGQLSIESWASNDLSNILGEFNPETSPANQKAYLGHELSRLAAIVERGIVDATENKVQKKRALLILTALINSSDEHEQNLVLGLWEYLLSPSSRLEVGEDGFPLHLNAQDDLVTDNLLFIRFLTELVSNLTLTSFKFGLQADIFFLPLINYANQKLLTVVDSENYKDGQSMALAHWLTQFLNSLMFFRNNPPCRFRCLIFLPQKKPLLKFLILFPVAFRRYFRPSLPFCQQNEQFGSEKLLSVLVSNSGKVK